MKAWTLTDSIRLLNQTPKSVVRTSDRIFSVRHDCLVTGKTIHENTDHYDFGVMRVSELFNNSNLIGWNVYAVGKVDVAFNTNFVSVFKAKYEMTQDKLSILIYQSPLMIIGEIDTAVMLMTNSMPELKI